MPPYSVGNTYVFDSNGITVNDSPIVIKQLTNLTEKFETSTQADGKNILAISESSEKSDVEMKQVFSSGNL